MAMLMAMAGNDDSRVGGSGRALAYLQGLFKALDQVLQAPSPVSDKCSLGPLHCE